MDIKQLIEKMDQFAGQAVGQKPGDQWKGTDKGTPGKKLVGDSILKDLSKGKKAKSKEQELAEEWANFNEEDLGTHPKRPGRKSDRHSRGHEPQPRYKTVKADESAMSEKDIELQDYRSMSHKEFQTAHGMTKTEWINKNKALVIQNPKLKQALGLDEGAEQDPIVATVVKQMRPGLTGLNMGNEAFLYFAYELGKQRARDAWSDYLPAIRAEYEKGLSEGWESGPEEYEEPYDDADDAYDRQRQEKIDTEAEKEWAKLPKVSTYKLVGRGPNMEPNHEFGDEFDTLEQALEYRSEIMKDPKTPNPEHIGIRTITRVANKEQTNEAIYTAPRNREEYDAKMQALQDLQTDRNNVGHKDLQDRIAMYLANLEKLAVQKGWKQPQPNLESRGHTVIANKLKDVERAKKFASGELKVPTPQERQAQLKQLEKAKPVKEYGANNVSPYGQPTAQNVDPNQAQQVAANLNTQKTALTQLKQINPEIDPLKAATAATKDVATMNPQEKEELAQVAKTLSPALGTPALGSIKTALQKSQAQVKTN